jgi:hypothetical protein
MEFLKGDRRNIGFMVDNMHMYGEIMQSCALQEVNAWKAEVRYDIYAAMKKNNFERDVKSNLWHP